MLRGFRGQSVNLQSGSHRRVHRTRDGTRTRALAQVTQRACQLVLLPLGLLIMREKVHGRVPMPEKALLIFSASTQCAGNSRKLPTGAPRGLPFHVTV